MLIMFLVGLVILASSIYVKGKEEVTKEIRQNSIETNVFMNSMHVSYNQTSQYMETTFNLQNSDLDMPELSDIINLVYSMGVISKKNNREYKSKVFVLTINGSSHSKIKRQDC